MDTQVFNKEHIAFDATAKTQDEAFHAIAKLVHTAGFVEEEHLFYKGLCEREEESTTGFTDGIAIPHSKCDTVKKPGVFLIKFANPIEWNSLDGELIRVAIALTIPNNGGENHLRILSKIARKMIHEEFRTALKSTNEIDILYKTIAQIEL